MKIEQLCEPDKLPRPSRNGPLVNYSCIPRRYLFGYSLHPHPHPPPREISVALPFPNPPVSCLIIMFQYLCSL